MRELNNKQKKLLDQFIQQYYEGSGGTYPLFVDNINPFLWAEIVELNDHETLYQNANRYIMDRVLEIRYKK